MRILEKNLSLILRFFKYGILPFIAFIILLKTFYDRQT